MTGYYHTLDEEIGKFALCITEKINKKFNDPFVIHGGCATQIYIIKNCQEEEWEKYLRTTSDLDLTSPIRVTKSYFRKVIDSIISMSNEVYIIKSEISHNFYSIEILKNEKDIFKIHIPKLSKKEYNNRLGSILRTVNSSKTIEVFDYELKVESPENNIYNKLCRCQRLLSSRDKLENMIYKMIDKVKRDPFLVKDELYQLRNRAISEIESLGYSKLISKIKIIKDLYDITILVEIGIVDESTLHNLLKDIQTRYMISFLNI